MAIEFHCEHCRAPIKAPEGTEGNRGRCPHCKGTLYIPGLPDQDTELPLAPLDPEEEARRRRAFQEALEVQRELLHEQAVPGETAPRRTDQAAPARRPAAEPVASQKSVHRQVVEYVEVMAGGRLNRANELVRELTRFRSQVLELLDGMEAGDAAAYGLPALPRPVLLGFLKQLRAKL